MAWGRRQDHPAVEVENIVGASAEVRGDLRATGGFRIDGKIDGNVESEGPVVIGDGGHVRGNVRGSDVVVVGKVDGNVLATGHLDIGKSGKVVGDVTATSMRIETGGVLRGTSFMGPSEDVSEKEQAAPPTEAATVPS